MTMNDQKAAWIKTIQNPNYQPVASSSMGRTAVGFASGSDPLHSMNNVNNTRDPHTRTFW